MNEALSVVETIFWPTFKALLFVGSICGFGSLVAKFFKISQIKNLRFSETILLWVLLGMTGWSVLFMLLGYFSLLSPQLIYLIEVLGLGIFLFEKKHLGHLPRLSTIEIFLTLIIACGFAIFYFEAISSPFIHPDAIQYHFALPSHYLRAGKVFHMPTIGMSGAYLGSDILLMGAPDLADPLKLYTARLVSFFFNILFPWSTYLCARRFGLSRTWSFTALSLLFLLSGFPRICDGKNDLISAAVQLVWLILVQASLPRELRLKIRGPIFLIGAYSLAIKVSALPLVLMIFAISLFLSPIKKIKDLFVIMILIVFPLLPWVLMGYRGSPFFR